MTRLLLIALFLVECCHGASIPTRRLNFQPATAAATVGDWILLSPGQETNDTTARLNYNVTAVTIPSNTLVFAVVNSATTGGSCTFTGAFVNWTQLTSSNYFTLGTPTHVLDVFVTITNNDVNNQRVGALFTANRSACDVKLIYAFNVTNSLAAIIQTNNYAIDNGTPTNFMAALAATGTNAVLGFFGSELNPPAITPESGWREFADYGINTPATGIGIQGRVGTTDNTIGNTSGAVQDYASLAVELTPRQVAALIAPIPTIVWMPVHGASFTNESLKVPANTTWVQHDGTYGASKFGAGYSLVFDGAAGDGESSSAITYGTNIITVTWWANHDATWATQVPLESSANYNSNPNAWIFYFDVLSSTNTVVLGINGDNPGKRICFPPPSDSAWHFYAGVYDNSTATGNVKLYIDGVEKTGKVDGTGSTKTTTAAFSAYVLYLGSRARGASLFWPGKMEEVRIYSGELSSVTINQIYNETRK